jgi:hypothetical protein
MPRPNNPDKSFKTFKQEGDMKPSTQDEVKRQDSRSEGQDQGEGGKSYQ